VKAVSEVLGSDILSFSGDFRWLSNFWSSKVELDGIQYPSIENAYQAAKTLDLNKREKFRFCNAYQSKQFGKMLKLRPDWNNIRIDIMYHLISQKFYPRTNLAYKLINTGNVNIVEGNDWNDTFWGICNGVGKNMLGRLIMEHREYLQYET
jgi:ribA/ribD-fused uncharacterized protein